MSQPFKTAFLPCDRGFRMAAEVRIGRAVVVVVEHEDGTIGIGNIVQRDSETDAFARAKCLAHAHQRIRSFQRWKKQGAA